MKSELQQTDQPAVAVPDGIIFHQCGPTIRLKDIARRMKHDYPDVQNINIADDAINIVCSPKVTDDEDAIPNAPKPELIMSFYRHMLVLLDVYEAELARMRWEYRWPN